MSNISKGPRRYVEVAFTPTKTVNAGAGWVDWDLSTVVPAGCLIDVVGVLHTSGNTVGIRNKGSTDDRRIVAYDAHRNSLRSNVNGASVCQVYDHSGASSADYILAGYWA